MTNEKWEHPNAQKYKLTRIGEAVAEFINNQEKSKEEK